jgi:hypothetical protein
LYGKAQRRRFATWLWFIKCVLLYLQKKNIKIYKTFILNVIGLIKIHKHILKYILNTFKKLKILVFLLKLKLKYRGVKLKHFTTLRKRVHKRIVKTEHRSYGTF